MALSLERALKTKVLADCRLKAGEQSLKNRITWVHCGDSLDMGSWLKGGELLLTCLHGAGNDKDLQLDFINQVYQSGANALGIEVGYYFSKIPPHLIEICNHLELPLLEIPAGKPFVDISQNLLPLIIGKNDIEKLCQTKECLRKMIAEELAEYILTKKFAKASLLLDEISISLTRQRCNAATLKFQMLQILQVISWSAFKICLNSRQTFRFQNILREKIQDFSLPDKYITFVCAAFNDLISLFKVDSDGEVSALDYSLKYMVENYHQAINLSEIAAAANLSTSHLSRILRFELGMTANEILTQMRIDAAREKLFYENIPLKKIAYQVGFNNVSYFSRVFKKETGFPPGEYRDRFEILKT